MVQKNVFQQGISLWKLVYTSLFEIIFLGVWLPCQSKLQGTDSIPKDGNATWPLATPFLEVLITPEITTCVPGCLLEFLISLLAFILLNFIIISSSLYRFPPVWMCFPGCYLSVTLMYWLMPAGPSHIYQMDLMIKFRPSLMQEYVGDLWSCWCKIS